MVYSVFNNQTGQSTFTWIVWKNNLKLKGLQFGNVITPKQTQGSDFSMPTKFHDFSRFSRLTRTSGNPAIIAKEFHSSP